MNREDKINFIKESALFFDEVELDDEYFKNRTDEQIDEEAERYDYLWEK